MSAEGVLYAIDPYAPGRLGISLPQIIAHAEVGRLMNGTVQWIQATGLSAATQLHDKLLQQVDFLFIDGDHSYEGLKGDWTSWSPLIKPGGVVALHDSRATPNRPIHDAGSVRYCQEVIVYHPGFEVIEFVDSLTILRARSSVQVESQ